MTTDHKTTIHVRNHARCKQLALCFCVCLAKWIIQIVQISWIYATIRGIYSDSLDLPLLINDNPSKLRVSESWI